MNKILNINLGGHPVTSDDDAYEYLKAYLENIRRRFTESDGRDEIMRDVEDRLGELVNQYKGNNTIVMLPHVESAIEIMGKPEDFGGEPAVGTSADTTTSTGGKSQSSGSGGTTLFGQQLKTGKRLFRDENDSVISGVCSGFSAYFGIPDPIWIRLIFVLLALGSFGLVIPFYILMMIIVPPARSATERLEMKGEPINVDSIAREFEKGYENLSNRVSNGGGNKFARGTAAATGGCVYILGKLGVGLMILISVSLILGLGSAWVAGIFAFFTAEPYMTYFSPLSDGMTYFGVFCGFMVLGLPVVSLCLWLGRTIFRFQNPVWLKNTLGALWVFCFLSLIGLGAFIGKNFRTGSTVNKSVDLTNVPSDTLKVSWADRENIDREDHVRWDWPWSDGSVYINDDKIVLREFVRILVRKSTTGKFECRQDIRARGANSTEAMEHANASGFNAYLEGNELKVPSKMQFDKSTKWWLRQITIYIGVPEGKCIVFDDQIYHVAAADYDDYAPGNDENYISRTPGMVYRMTKEGINCSTCPNFGDANYRSDKRYENFIFEGDFDVEMREGDDFSMRIEGDREVLESIPSGNKLTITTNNKTPNSKTKVIIETPVLTMVSADNTGLVTIRSFDEGNASISAKGKSVIKAYLDASDYLDVTLSDQSRMILSGKGGELRATLSDDANLDALDWRASEVKASANGNSKGRAFARDNASIRVDANADFKVEGTSDIERK